MTQVYLFIFVAILCMIHDIISLKICTSLATNYCKLQLLAFITKPFSTLPLSPRLMRPLCPGTPWDGYQPLVICMELLAATQVIFCTISTTVTVTSLYCMSFILLIRSVKCRNLTRVYRIKGFPVAVIRCAKAHSLALCGNRSNVPAALMYFIILLFTSDHWQLV